MIYGLIGEKLGHSFSVPIHKALGNPDYRLYELSTEELPDFLSREDIGGLNVTIPYKQTVMKYCSELSEGAASIGSVNTLLRRNGKLIGFNTDIDGFIFAVKYAGLDFKGKKVLILGSGGTSRTARAAAKVLGATEILTVSRKGPITYDDLKNHSDAGIIVNATPMGMYPKNLRSLVDFDLFPKLSGVMDVIYNPHMTKLLLDAKERGIPNSGGLLMLTAQATAAEEIFFDCKIADSKNMEIASDILRSTLNIVLTGMPGSGKSAIGAELSRLTGRPLLDTDEMIKEKTGESPAEIINNRGEAAFRKLEAEAVEEAAYLSGRIIATGGGTVTTPSNYNALRQNGRVYCIKRPLKNLSVNDRPLSGDTEKLKKLFDERKKLYRLFADKDIENNGTVKEAAAALREDFNENTGY